jgi:DNA topoisomerase I
MTEILVTSPNPSRYWKESFLLATGCTLVAESERVKDGWRGYCRAMTGTVTEPIEDAPESSARAAGLRYVSDRDPGFARRRRGRGFQYIGADGGTLSSEQVERIEALAIPPAWTDVWICRSANGHLQATGRDARGRKQYRYHPRWREVRDETKYHRLLAFGRALPWIRRRVEKDMSRRALSRERVVATVVHLLDTTNIRVGNDEYARENKSFGLTTMRERHVEVDGSRITFRFRGKSGKMHDVELTDPRAARVLRRCEELPGQELFQYVSEDGEVVDIDSDDVNGYLQDVSGDDFTAKDFRTWSGTVLAAWALQELGQFGSQTQAKRQVVAAVESVSTELGNTPAICRRCYVHPEVFDAHLDGSLGDVLEKEAARKLSKDLAGLTPEEAAVLALLSRRLEEERG